MENLLIIRPPQSFRYMQLDVREETIVSYWLGYLKAINMKNYVVYDFNLDRTLDIERILTEPGSRDCVVACREVGDNPCYAYRVGKAILERTQRRVIFYGNVGRLPTQPAFEELKETHGRRVEFVIQDEPSLARLLGLSDQGPIFGQGLQLEPYGFGQKLDPMRRKRMKASVETTRGCHFPCRFCFINTSRNYPARWVRRPNADILADIKTFYDTGVNNVVFADSEFFGAKIEDYHGITELLESMVIQFPGLHYKIYSRADTILAFGNLELLKRSGLVSVFIGVESLVDEDLVMLKKKTTASTLMKAITALADAKIYMDLSFIVFNRNTTFETLAENLERLAILYRRNPRYLGMPLFSFSFEVTWQVEATRPLSSQTYVAIDLATKFPSASGAVFNPDLEPLMEIYRLLSYEWSAKVTQLNLRRPSASPEQMAQMEEWFRTLPYFCLEVMKYFLDLARQSHLTLDSLNAMRDHLFDMIIGFYCRTLPAGWLDCPSRPGHAGVLDYGRPVGLLEPEEYWYDAIPPVKQDYWERHRSDVGGIH